MAPRGMEQTVRPPSVSIWHTNWRVLWRILGLLRPHAIMTVETLISTMLATAFALIIPWLLAWVVDAGVTSGQFGTLLLAAAAVLVASGLRGLFAYWQGYLSQAVSVLVAYDLRQRIYNHLQRLSFSFHDESETGQLMSRLTADIEGVQTYAARLPASRCSDPDLWRRLHYPGGSGLAARTGNDALGTDIDGTWLASSETPGVLSGIAYASETGKLGTVMQESLSGRRVVMSFVREEFEIGKYETKNREVRDLTLAALRLSAWNQPLMVLALNVVTVLVLWVGHTTVIHRHLSLGILVAVITYALLLATPVRTFGFMITWFMRGVAQRRASLRSAGY